MNNKTNLKPLLMHDLPHNIMHANVKIHQETIMKDANTKIFNKLELDKLIVSYKTYILGDLVIKFNFASFTTETGKIKVHNWKCTYSGITAC